MIEEKENVGVKALSTEQGATAQECGRGERKPDDKIGSTVWEKFKDADALAKAYGSLQAEFTRRSQRLKELERRLDNWKSTEKEGIDAENEAEKLRKKAEEKREKQREFDSFVNELENARGKTRALTETAAEEPETVQKSAENAAEKGAEIPLRERINIPNSTATDGESETIRVEERSEEGAIALTKGEKTVTPVATSEKTVESSESLYQRVCKDETVRLRIIGEYLSSLGKSGAPMMQSGAGAYAMPPAKAKTIAEAGNMALRFLKK